MSKHHVPRPAPQSEPAVATGPVRAWVRFWFTPTDPVGLHVLRLLVGLLLLAWLLPLAGQQDTFFGLGGWFDRRAYIEAGRLPDGPPHALSWSILYLCGDDPVRLGIAYWGSIAVLALFTVGFWPRVSSVLSWVIAVSFAACPATVADADCLLVVLAFYVMVGYLLAGWRTRANRLPGPWRAWPLTNSLGRPSVGANLGLRLLQVHVAVVVVVMGLHKLQYGDWWAGVALWYPLHPPFETTAGDLRPLMGHAREYLGILSAAAYATLAWQIGFPLFAWRPRWRLLLLGGAAVGWVGSALLYELPLFGPAVFVGCLAYPTPVEWHGLFRLLGRLPGVRSIGRRSETRPDGARGGQPRKEKVASPVLLEHHS